MDSKISQFDDATLAQAKELNGVIPIAVPGAPGSNRKVAVSEFGAPVTVDSTLDNASTNPVENQAIAAAMQLLQVALAPEYVATDPYAKGAIVSKGYKVYKAKRDTPAGWVAEDWKETTIAEELARKGEAMKTFILAADSGKTYTFTGNARAAVFTQTSTAIALKALCARVSDSVAVGFKAGDTVKIIAAQVKAGQAAGLQSPAMAVGVTGLSASLQFDIVALASDGTVADTGYGTLYLKELDWNEWEQKGLEVTLPAALPAGATCFGITYSGAFSCDDYNIQTTYVGQTVTPEIMLEVNTSSDKLAAVSDGTDVS